jgi:phage tail tape-measure protein
MAALVQVLVAIGGMVGAALLIKLGRIVAELAGNVRESSTATRGLAADVKQIKIDAARDRERLAAVEAAVWWPHEHHKPRWREIP